MNESEHDSMRKHNNKLFDCCAGAWLLSTIALLLTWHWAWAVVVFVAPVVLLVILVVWGVLATSGAIRRYEK